MENKLSEEVVSAIKNSLPKNENIVNFLSDMFGWSKESTYRRLKYQIPFTFEEVATIASKIDFSIDNILGLKKTDRLFFNLNLYQSKKPEDIYYEKIEFIMNFSLEILKFNSQRVMLAINYIPTSFGLYLETFTKFTYYRWLHYEQYISPECMMSDIKFPEKIEYLRQSFISQKRNNMTGIFILDRNVFLSAITHINYFYERGLINEIELELLKKELRELVDQLDVLAKDGVNITGSKIDLYLSSVDIMIPHSYVEYGNNICSHYHFYGIDTLQSYSPKSCLVQKEWIEQLRRYSTLITKSNEKERLEYFNLQRIYIKEAGNN